MSTPVTIKRKATSTTWDTYYPKTELDQIVDWADTYTSIQSDIDTQGVPTGGAATNILAKASSTNYDTEWIPIPAGESNVSFNGTVVDNIDFTVSGSTLTITTS